MSVRLMALVFSCNMPELKTSEGQTVPDTTAKFILLALADSANDEGEGSYPSVDTLCEKTNYSTSTICNALNALRTNEFTSLKGKSKYGTNDYTVSVARVLSFQWPKRADSSHRNDAVSATETNPSINPSVKPIKEISKKKSSSNPEPTPEMKSIIEKANREVDFILRQIGLSAGKSWTLLPEVYHPYGKAFCGATGITYTKADFHKWTPAFETWTQKGHTPQTAIDAIQCLKEEGKSGMISGPSSITWKMDAMVTERQARQEKVAKQQEQAPLQIPDGWLKYYENVPTA